MTSSNSISQGGITTGNNLGIEVSASQIHAIADKSTMRTARRLKQKKSEAQLALESQEGFDCMKKASKKLERRRKSQKIGKASTTLKGERVSVIRWFFGA